MFLEGSPSASELVARSGTALHCAVSRPCKPVTRLAAHLQTFVITSDICVCMAAEREAVAAGTQRLLLLTTRTADWFEQRGFQPAGAAHLSDLLPTSRRIKVCPSSSASLHPLWALFDRCLDVSVWFCDCSSCLVAAAFADPLHSKWHANVVMCDMQVDPARNSKLFIKQLATEPLPMPEV